jgi:hypothetical protein
MSSSPQIKLGVHVAWKDKAIWFERFAPTLPIGVCWMVGMSVWKDEISFDIRSIEVGLDGSVMLFVDDISYTDNCSEDEFQEWIDNGWEGTR